MGLLFSRSHCMVKTMVFCTDCSSYKTSWIKFRPTMIIPSSLSRTMWKHSILLFLPDGYFVIESDFLPPTLQLFCLFSAQKESQMKLWKRWSKQRFNALWFNLSSVPVVSGRLSLPLRTHDQFQHWTTPTNSAVCETPQYGPYLTHAHNNITRVMGLISMA